MTTINIHNHSYTHSDAHLSHGFAPMPHCPRPEAHGKVHPQDSAIEMSALTAIVGVVGRAAEAVPAVEMGKAQAPVLGAKWPRNMA